MNLENEYYHWKKMLKMEEVKLDTLKNLSEDDVKDVEAYNRSIKSAMKNIDEYTDIINEIKSEMEEVI